MLDTMPMVISGKKTSAVVHADYVCESEPESNSISKSTTIVLGHCRVPAVGDNTVTFWLLVAGKSKLCISVTITTDEEGTAAWDCSGQSPEHCSYSCLRKRHRLSYEL